MDTGIDPVMQELPDKYKDIVTQSRVRIQAHDKVHWNSVHWIPKEFETEMAQGKGSKAPLTDSFAKWSNAKIVILALIMDGSGAMIIMGERLGLQAHQIK